jgi:hypothetical protein
VYSLLGHLLVSTTTDFNRINIQNISKGVYIVAVYSGNRKSFKKMIVN